MVSGYGGDIVATQSTHGVILYAHRESDVRVDPVMECDMVKCW